MVLPRGAKGLSAVCDRGISIIILTYFFKCVILNNVNILTFYLWVHLQFYRVLKT